MHPKLALALLLLLLLLPVASSAAETAYDDLRAAETDVEVDGYPVRAGGEIGLADDAVELHPLGLAGVGWDETGQGGRTAGSAFARLLAGLESTWHVDQADDLLLRLDATVQRYEEAVRPTRFGWVARTMWRRRAPELEADVQCAVERSDETPSQVGTDVANVQAGGLGSVALQGDGNRLAARLHAWRTTYHEGSALFLPEQRDHRALDGEAGWEMRAGESLGLRLRGGAGVRDFERQDVFQDRLTLVAAAAVRSALGERSFALAEVGWESWRMQDDFRRDPARDDQRADLISGTLAARFSWEEGSHVEATLGRHLGESLTANVAQGVSLVGLGRLRLSERSGMWLRIEASQQRDLAEAASVGPALEDRRTVEARLVGEWNWTRGLMVRPRLLAIDSRSDAGGDYRRLQGALEVAVAW